MKSNMFFAFILFTIACLLLLHCSLGLIPGGDLPGDDDVQSLRYGSGGRPAGGGEEEDTGNCLSVPVLFSDGVTKTLRGEFGAPVFDGEYVTDAGGTNWYLQQDPLNRWQAKSEVINAPNTVYVSRIDWGDNLEAKSWPVNAKIRVETVLWKDLETPMTAFTMGWLSGAGMDEMWGTNAVQYGSTKATVYSGCARLTIQKLEVEDLEDPRLADLEWQSDEGVWAGEVITDEPMHNNGVWDEEDGPGGYSAEINVGGKLIYGFNWDAKADAAAIGYYRITFSLYNKLSDVTLNTSFLGAQIESGGEESDVGEIPSGGKAVVDADNNLTYIDVELVKAKGGGKGGPPRS